MYIEMTNMECPVCGVPYTLTEELHSSHTKNGTSWYCPNGHSLSFNETELDRIKKELAEITEKNNQAINSTKYWRTSSNSYEKSANSYKGHFTRMKNKYEPTKIDES